ncbi:acyl-CoA Delta(11) desaturase-like [Sipha flava]|uniref:Acyl-CoA Delta(11) desaturase-like n=1 Tax=Sipha flava TaxID=143950 RepID=A0A8B8FWC0_9HEMI|nr:acyl-CoA Delta(11) desaturase-like [Sipha flava]
MQTSTNTTTITQADELHRKTNLLQEVRKEDKRTDDGGLGELFRWQVTGQEIIWTHVIVIVLLHVFAVNSFMSYMITTTKFQTTIWGFIVGGIGGFGVTGGAHRYYTHRSFKAKFPLQLILIACYTVSGQNSIPTWVRDHRVHHKFSETDADPHNANRGFFFSHVGWLMQRKHPEVHRRGRTVNMSDIANDPLVQFHTKHFLSFKLLLCFILPTIIPVMAWNESWADAFNVICIFRYALSLNFTWSVNSVAHIWGNKPYDKHIRPVQNAAVSVLAMGEGWHNYHHAFPSDYRAAELGTYALNVTTMWLDAFALLGWAYDLKTPSEELVRRVADNHGDGTRSCGLLENDRHAKNSLSC